MKEIFRSLDIGRTEELDMNSFRNFLDQCSIPMSESGKSSSKVLTVEFNHFFQINQKDGFVKYSTLSQNIKKSVQSQSILSSSVSPIFSIFIRRVIWTKNRYRLSSLK